MFSNRLDWDAPSNAIARLLAEKRLAGERILDLTESNPTHAGISYPGEVISAALAGQQSLSYEPEPFGMPGAREAVARAHDADAQWTVLTASTSEAYAWLFKLLANPGDEVLVPRPSYPLFDYLARLESVHLVQYPLFYDYGWHLDPAALAALVTPRTRAIVTVHPNNPTGSFLKRHEFEQMSAIASTHNLAIISDEVFLDYAFAPDDTRCGILARHDTPSLTFSLGGLSKSVGLPQMKLAWVIAGGPAVLRDAALRRLEFIADTYLSVGAPVQCAADALLGLRRAVQDQIRERTAHNLRTLATKPLDVLAVEGGWYATVRMPRTRTEEEYVLDLLMRANVLVQPGYFYDFDSEAYLVVSLLTPETIFEEGIAALC